MMSLPQWYDDARLQRRKGVFERIWRGTDHSEPNGCWPWTGYRRPWSGKPGQGYGMITVAGEARHVTRALWETVVGTIPDGLNVLHRCDNPGCCNLAHLFLGTHAENMADKKAKGRVRFGPTLFGVDNPAGKLTDEQVATIRASAEPQRGLAARFGVTQGHISGIKNRTKRK